MIRCCSTLIWEVKRVNKLRVLIVDDSARTISLIKDSLSEDTEVEIVGQAENGVEAIEMIRETKPDVVFLDLIMPKMDGLLVLEKVCQGLPGIETVSYTHLSDSLLSFCRWQGFFLFLSETDKWEFRSSGGHSRLLSS